MKDHMEIIWSERSKNFGRNKTNWIRFFVVNTKKDRVKIYQIISVIYTESLRGEKSKVFETKQKLLKACLTDLEPHVFYNLAPTEYSVYARNQPWYTFWQYKFIHDNI